MAKKKKHIRYGAETHIGNEIVIRDIRGELYNFDSDHVTKEEAQKRAKEIRDPYTSVRVIKGYAADGGWTVWVLRCSTKKALRNLGLLK